MATAAQAAFSLEHLFLGACTRPVKVLVLVRMLVRLHR